MSEYQGLVGDVVLGGFRGIATEMMEGALAARLASFNMCRVSNLHSPRETDFESVVVTTWLGPVQTVPHRNHHEKILKVSNLYSPRETDFESVVVTTWLGSVKMDLHRDHHEQIFKTQLALFSIETIMSKYSSPRETDFESVGVTT
ncbi:hypothetical protein EV702DRAFT_1046566 [Suillus placidus]|uniref:Uncharacterized protein n=1 Tax=Suillus placidus TaxID=48579 RepID=A0A9P7D1D2_9AGAM|nr:hypothetical protein EV702DRAFT_1046566 [Suillus placidus]